MSLRHPLAAANLWFNVFCFLFCCCQSVNLEKYQTIEYTSGGVYVSCIKCFLFSFLLLPICEFREVSDNRIYLRWSLCILYKFTCMPGESYHSQLMSLLLCLCDICQVLIKSLVCWFYQKIDCLIVQQGYEMQRKNSCALASGIWLAIHVKNNKS